MFSPAVLAGALDSVADAWSLPSDIATTKVHHLYRQVHIVGAEVVRFPAFRPILEPFGPVWDAWLSMVLPGGFILEHCDAGPYWERWQVPFTTEGTLYQLGEPVAHEVGVPFRVTQYEWHSVANDDDSPRISLVINRRVRLDVPNSPLRVRCSDG